MMIAGTKTKQSYETTACPAPSYHKPPSLAGASTNPSFLLSQWYLPCRESLDNTVREQRLNDESKNTSGVSMSSTQQRPLIDCQIRPNLTESSSSQTIMGASLPDLSPISESSICAENKPSGLIPFSHQVGGHECVLKLSDRVIYKPLRERERTFYERIRLDESSLITEFLPKYYGVAEIGLFEEGESVKLLVRQLNHSESLQETDRVSSMSSPIKIDIESSLLTHAQSDNTNPWSTHLFHMEMRELAKHETKGKQFIILEDLTYGFRYPCILDMKLGIRQYGLNASLEKRERHKSLCASTTSSVLGLRICGMQVYKISIGKFHFESKYQGRLLTIDTFSESLLRFFHNGERIMIEYIPAFIEKLQRLIDCLEHLPGHRFFSSSLLFVYDSDATPESAALKMIDFDNSTVDIMQEDLGQESDEDSLLEEARSPDRNCLFGLYNLKHLLENLNHGSVTSP
jgi:inositol-hexakisphosphate 5-kinase